MLTRHKVRGDKKLDAHVKAAVGVPLLIPPDRAHWADVHHRAGGTSPLEGANRVPLARWCGAVRAFARGAEPLAGNCFLVAGPWLSPSGEYRQPVNIMVPRRP